MTRAQLTFDEETLRHLASELMSRGHWVEMVTHPMRYHGFKRMVRVGRVTDVGERRLYMAPKETPPSEGPHPFSIPWGGVQSLRALPRDEFLAARPRSLRAEGYVR